MHLTPDLSVLTTPCFLDGCEELHLAGHTVSQSPPISHSCILHGYEDTSVPLYVSGASTSLAFAKTWCSCGHLLFILARRVIVSITVSNCCCSCRCWCVLCADLFLILSSVLLMCMSSPCHSAALTHSRTQRAAMLGCIVHEGLCGYVVSGSK